MKTDTLITHIRTVPHLTHARHTVRRVSDYTLHVGSKVDTTRNYPSWIPVAKRGPPPVINRPINTKQRRAKRKKKRRRRRWWKWPRRPKKHQKGVEYLPYSIIQRIKASFARPETILAGRQPGPNITRVQFLKAPNYPGEHSLLHKYTHHPRQTRTPGKTLTRNLEAWWKDGNPTSDGHNTRYGLAQQIQSVIGKVTWSVLHIRPGPWVHHKPINDPYYYDFSLSFHLWYSCMYVAAYLCTLRSTICTDPDWPSQPK